MALGGKWIQLELVPSPRCFYTWNNKQRDDKRVYSRIDRVLVNGDWLTTLPSSEVHFGNEGLMDHCPAMLNWEDGTQRTKPRFYYFNMWSQASDFQQKVRENWTKRIDGTKMFQLVGKLNRLKGTLRSINKRHFNEVEIKADKAKTELEECQTALQHNPTNADLIQTEIQLAETYHKLHQARIQFLKQKSKLHWLTEGDLNAAFYHNMLKVRRNKNRVFNIRDSSGLSVTDPPGVAKAFLDFYTALLGTSNAERTHVCSATVKKTRP
ncbi:uncharacterized protein LOC132047721 [Lycium ferocissimum]|uniref:uncharacterized protein LOC132047721 n=1 Tax=Lycium ferocissimum TaxID=112874 RepID=UPI0028149BB8|nr:uncharacterized protein LOC132047721 [Lycium ferocissimum]